MLHSGRTWHWNLALNNEYQDIKSITVIISWHFLVYRIHLYMFCHLCRGMFSLLHKVEIEKTTNEGAEMGDALMSVSLQFD